jgi:hypothetical protein
MTTSIIVTDDFYSNPHEVRAFALQQDFKVRGNFPGQRTLSFLNDSTKETIENIIRPHAGNITWWGGEGENMYTGSFQYTTAADRTWIHSDYTTKWAGVLYLTPDAPHTSGSGLFRHKSSGMYQQPYLPDGSNDLERDKLVEHDFQDYTKWDLFDVIGNRFNRLAMYRGDFYHASLDYFGTNKENGRLFQLFFFNTER